MDTPGKRLNWAREELKLTQEELAHVSGLSSTRHIGLIEEGQRANITTATAVGLCRSLGCSLDWLLLGKGSPPTDAQMKAAIKYARKYPLPKKGERGETAAE